MKKRNEFIDLLKGILIVLVVIGHCIQYGSGMIILNNQIFFDNIVFKIIYSFHMPCFMIISGYLFYFSVKKYKVNEVFIRKTKKYLVPIISFTLIIAMLNFIFRVVNIKDMIYNFKYYFVLLWFFWAVFIYSILVSLVNRFLNDNFLIYFVIFIITLFIPKLNTITFMYPYFIFGYYFNKCDYVNKIKCIEKKYKYISLTLLLIIFIFLINFYGYDSYVYTSGICLLNKNIVEQLIIDIYRYTIGFIGSFCFIGIVSLAYKNINCCIRNLLMVLGKETFGIYALSSSSMYIVFPKVIKNITGINYFAIIGESFVTLIVCLFLIKLINKFKILSYLILGNTKK